jgi:S-adenosylmethionine:tRNA ribosyltransferase-isomerase
MPSAGRPLSPRVVAQLTNRGVRIAAITLHTGVSSLETGERPYPERYRVPEATAIAVNETRRNGGRVIAVGNDGRPCARKRGVERRRSEYR